MSFIVATCAPGQALAETRSVVKQGTISNFYTYIEPPTAALRPNSIEDSISNGKVKLECESDSVQLQSNGAVWYYDSFSASTTPYEVPTYKITYGDAILLTDGTTADFVLTVTNEQFYVTSSSSYTVTPLFAQKGYISGIKHSINPVATPNTQNSSSSSYGYRADSRDIKITVEKNGEPVDCSLLLSMVDLDMKGMYKSQLGAATNSPSFSYDTTQSAYLESVCFNAEDDGLLSDVYIPSTSYLNPVTENGQLKLLPTASDSETYNSGFAVLISGKGANVHWEGTQGCYSSFTLPDVALAYNIAAEVTQNSVGAGPGLGTITTTATYSEDNVQTVSTTNANNTYKSALNITHGTNAVCTITPDEGYVIDTFTIDGSAVVPPARNTDGSYTYTFSDNSNHEITASFGIEKTVTYKTSEHGSVNKETETVVQGHTPTGATPTADTGYAFNKWVADKAVTLSDGTKISSGDTITQAQLTKVVITEDVTFTAKFKVGSAYTINYVLDGGTNASTNPDDYTVETPTITLADPSRVGYTFTGWTTTGVTTPTKALTIPKGSTGEKTFTANWSINQYTVTFDSHGGTNVASQSVDYNTTATEPNPTPTKDNLSFAGWYTSTTFTDENKYSFDTPVTDNMTLHACWQATVSFVTNTGDAQTVASQTVDEGGCATVPTEALTKTGYSFDDWYGTSDLSGVAFDFEETAIAKNTTLYAKWNPVSYLITYELDGGTNASTNPSFYTIEDNDITFASPTKAGCTFLGWTIAHYSGRSTNETAEAPEVADTLEAADTPEVAATMVVQETLRDAAEPEINLVLPHGSTGGKTLTAHWSINQYTVEFDSHGGTDVASQSVDYNTTATVPNPAPTKDGLVFAGWYTSTTFTSDNKYNFNTPVTDNMTLHACWQATVSFVTNTDDSQTVASQAADEGGYATKPSDSLTKAGYIFEGWYDTPDFSGDVFDFASSAITENTTLYAKWSPETYTITYVLDGGTNASTNPTTYTVESDTITLLSPTREGYTFTGWTGAEVSEPTKGLVIPKGSVGNKTFTAHWESTVQPVPQPDNNNTTPEPDKTDPEKTTTTSTEGTVAKMGDALGAVVQALIACCVLGTGAVWVVCKRKRN